MPSAGADPQKTGSWGAGGEGLGSASPLRPSATAHASPWWSLSQPLLCETPALVRGGPETARRG